MCCFGYYSVIKASLHYTISQPRGQERKFKIALRGCNTLSVEIFKNRHDCSPYHPRGQYKEVPRMQDLICYGNCNCIKSCFLNFAVLPSHMRGGAILHFSYQFQKWKISTGRNMQDGSVTQLQTWTIFLPSWVTNSVVFPVASSIQ